MNRFLPVFSNGTRGPGVVEFDDKHKRGRFHARPDYTDVEIAGLCRWLNERDKGYPTVYPFEEFDAWLRRQETV